ncbi:FadR family transcriptional regulator [Paracoccus liaowanqingii]|uniref:FadR family transcriptional regulator n=1 Tax=Paracoccus liaowanqingii TaxID=2560053 RepID=A0A4Z1CRM8_9RHOB|nr:FadR/GntR family transcriptional regulator [Paracoccus liaowanqingii]QDA36378.1 FadR family transcriptional regulator [Paracoccus liaowanqingii]TGN67893.1 FadR family transcriptional regulator [Paracoccus liaowanqingii]
MSQSPTPISRTQHLPARIAGQFARQIQQGELKPGDRLPTENAMSKNFGVSRTVIREAIAQLRNEGMIETRQGVGAFVIDRPTRHIRLDDGAQMEGHDFRDLFQLRVPLEIEAAGLAATYHRPDHLRQMDEALVRMSATGENAEDGILADLDFHRTIAAATGNDYFVQFLGAVSDRILQTIVTSRERIRLDEIVAVVNREHVALRDAIAARDPTRARAAMRAHMAGSAARIALRLEFYS